MSRTWNRFNNYLVLAALSQLGVTCIMMETGQRTRTSTKVDLLVPRSPPWLCESSAQLIVPVSRMVSQGSYQTLLELSIVICITLWYMHRIGSTLVHLPPSVTPDIIHSFYANPPENQDHNLGKSVYHLQEDARSRASSSIWHRPSSGEVQARESQLMMRRGGSIQAIACRITRAYSHIACRSCVRKTPVALVRYLYPKQPGKHWYSLYPLPSVTHNVHPD